MKKHGVQEKPAMKSAQKDDDDDDEEEEEEEDEDGEDEENDEEEEDEVIEDEDEDNDEDDQGEKRKSMKTTLKKPASYKSTERARKYSKVYRHVRMKLLKGKRVTPQLKRIASEKARNAAQKAVKNM